MIERYTDHAANERTYLAWVRTALALVAFGLVVERFDLFARALPGQLGVPVDADADGFARVAGLGLTLLGVLVLAVSSHRYLRFKRLISSPETRRFEASRTDLVLVAIVVLLGLFMSGYVVAGLLR